MIELTIISCWWVQRRYATNVLGPISFSEAQAMVPIITSSPELPANDQDGKKHTQIWFEHVMKYNQMFKSPEAHDVFKHKCHDCGCLMDSEKNQCAQNGKKEVYGYKPVGMMRYLVARHITGPGQVIMDPFMGSGSTGIAALQMKCPFVGVEILPRRFFGAMHRLARELAEQL